MPTGSSGSVACDGLAERVARREAALLHRRGGQGGEADDVAGGVDVLDLGLEALVDLEAAAVVARQSPRVARSRSPVAPCRPTA